MTDRDHDAEEGERGERIAKWLARAGVGQPPRCGAADCREARAARQPRGGDAGELRAGGRSGDVRRAAGGGAAAHAPVPLPQAAGLVTTHRDERGRRTVFSALPPALPRVVSVGRLDLNSEGLLLLTNDGALARRLELPANGWLRRYRVRVHGAVDERALAELARGVTVEGVRYGEIEAGLDSRRGSNAWLTVALREGRNREVRRVMAHLRLDVTRLIRTAYGPFQLGALPPGAVEEVNPKVLREQLGLAPAPRPARSRGAGAPGPSDPDAAA